MVLKNAPNYLNPKQHVLLAKKLASVLKCFSLLINQKNLISLKIDAQDYTEPGMQTKQRDFLCKNYCTEHSANRIQELFFID